MPDHSKDEFSKEEADRRRDEVAKRMLKTPPRPHKDEAKKKTAKKRTK